MVLLSSLSFFSTANGGPATLKNNLAAGTLVNRITFNAASPANLLIGGNRSFTTNTNTATYASKELSVTGTISDATAILTKQGAGNLYLAPAGANTHVNTHVNTHINVGVVVTNNIGSVGTGTLRLGGTGNTATLTVRNLTAAEVGTATSVSSGTYAGRVRVGNNDGVSGSDGGGRINVDVGTTTFSNPAFNVTNPRLTVARTLTIAGSGGGNGIINGVIQDNSINGAISLNKLAAATWQLNGANTYTGKTKLGNGTLRVATIGSVGSTSSNLGAQTTLITSTMSCWCSSWSTAWRTSEYFV